MRRLSSSFAGLALAANLQVSSSPADRVRHPERITTTTADDYLPSLTPDGRSVLYVSDRKGNPDIFLRYLPGSGAVGDFPLTFHTARDTWPSVSPTGEQVAFVSYRADAKGDLYILNLRLADPIPEKIRARLYQRFGTVLSKSDDAIQKSGGLAARVTKYLLSQGSLVRLTDEKAAETEPAWGPSGDRIYFTRAANDRPEIFSITLPGKEIEPVTHGGGSMPAPSPDGRWLAFSLGGAIHLLDLRNHEEKSLTDGPFDLHPSWSNTSDRVFFSRYADDTNGDGTITVADRPSIFSADLSTPRLHRLTSGATYDLFPAARAGRILYSSREERGARASNLLSIPADGLFSAYKSGRDLFAAAAELEEGEPATAALAYEEIATAEALYHLGLVTDRHLSQPSRARSAWERAEASKETPWSSLAKIELLRQEFARSRSPSVIQLLSAIAGSNDPRIAGTALLETARAEHALGSDDRAAVTYDRVVTRCPKEEGLAAQALLEKTALYEKFGDTPKLLSNHLDLIRRYPNAEPYSSTAAQKMLDLWMAASPTEALKEAKLREIPGSYSSVPILPALAINTLGDRALGRNERPAAEAAYRSVIAQYPQEKKQKARAQLALARLLTDRGDYDQALALFREAERQVSKNDPWRKEARRRFVGGLLAKGKDELKGKDFRLAIRTFRDLISFDYEIPQAHRGLVAAYAALGETSKALSIYEDEQRRLPNHYLPRYAIGLAHTYEEPPATAFDRAEPDLLEAISQNGQAVFPHQTLGFVYEKRQELLNESGSVERAIDQYTIARSLSDPQEDFQNYGDLTLNVGNGYFLLGDYAKAYEHYSLRRSYDLSFDTETQRLVYLERFSRSAFHLERYDESVALADEALTSLDRVARDKSLPPKEILSHRAETNDARALSLQSRGRREEAAIGFTKVAELNQRLGRGANEAKAFRNLALNLFDAPPRQGSAEEKRLADARDAFEESFELLGRHGVATTRGKSIGSLVNIHQDVALGEDSSEASKGFSKPAERELLYTFIERLERTRGHDAEALAALDKKRSALPKESSVDVTKRPPLHLKESILANRRGVLLTRLNRFEEAAKEFQSSFALASALPHEIGMGQNALSLARLHSIAPTVVTEKQTMETLDTAFDRLTKRTDSDAAAFAARISLERLRLAELSLEENLLTSTLQRLRIVSNLLTDDEPLLLELDIAHFRWTGHAARRSLDLAALEQWAVGLKRNDLLLRLRSAVALSKIPANFAEISSALEPVLSFLTSTPAIPLTDGLDAVLPLFDRWLAFAVSEGDAEAAYNAAEWRSRIALQVAMGGVLPEHAATADGMAALDELKAALREGKKERIEAAQAALDERERGLGSLFRLGTIEAAELQEALGPNRGFLRGVETPKGLFRLFLRSDRLTLERADAPLSDLPRDLYIAGTIPCPTGHPCSRVASAAHLFYAFRAQNLFARSFYSFGNENRPPTSRTAVSWKNRTDLADRLGLADWFVSPAPLTFAVSPLRRWFDLPIPDAPRFEREVPASILLGSGVTTVFLPISNPPMSDGLLALLGEWWARGGVASVVSLPASAIPRALAADEGARANDFSAGSVFGTLGLTPEERQAAAETALAETVTQAASLYRTERWGESVRRFDQALRLLDAQKVDSGAGVTREQLLDVAGTAAYRSDDLPTAISYTQRLVEIRRKNSAPDGSVGLAKALQFLGVLQSRAEQFPESLAALTEAASLYQKLGSPREKVADTFSTLGVVYENANRYREALTEFDRSLGIYGKTGTAGAGEQWRRIGRIYYLRLNDYPRAEDAFRKAVEAFRGAKKPLLADEATLEIGLVFERRADFPKAREIYNAVPLSSKSALYVANTYWAEGNYFDAFRWQRIALAAAEQANDDRMRLLCHSTVGLIYWTLNQHDKAIEEQEVALKLSRKLVSPIDEAAAYNNAGLVYRDRGELEKSIALFEQALTIDQKLHTVWGEAYDRRNLGISQTRLSRFADAEKNLKEAVRLSHSIGARENETKSLQSLGDLYWAQSASDPAFDSYKQALSRARELGLKEVEWRALQGLARVTSRRKNIPGTLLYLKEAIDVVEKMGASIKIEEFRNSFVTNKLSLYQEIVLLLLRQQPAQTEEAWRYVERARSRSFIDLLGNRDVRATAPEDRVLLEKDRASRRLLTDLESRLGAASDDTERAKVQSQLRDARKVREDLLIEIRASRPELSAFVSVDVLTLPEFQKILGNDTAFVEYFLTPSELIAFVVTDQGIRVSRVQVGKKLLEAKLVAYSRLMQEQQPLLKESEELNRWILKPVEPWIEGKRFVGISPHETLHYLSYASLFDGKRFAVDRYALFYSPSASVLKYTTVPRRIDKGSARVLAIGNPNLGNPALDLPFAEKEVGAISLDFPKIETLTREKATERWVASNLGRFDIIHMAAHGEFDPINPLFSAIKLAPTESSTGDLAVEEIFNLRANADLVTLSACQTGLAKIEGGGELIGLNRAFLYAGTHSILSSLWRVSDVSTAILVKHFYRNYLTQTKAEALRKAQLLVKDYYSHPGYWAAFSLTGDYR
ncbi:MAG: CHAT domain-containing protein [Pseudomonadota bacterium]